MSGTYPRLRPLIALAVSAIIVSYLWGCSRESTTQAPSPAGGGAPVAGGSGPTGNRPPVILSAVIFPAAVTIDTELRVEVRGEDMDGDPVTYRYQWLVNGASAADTTAPQFKTDGLKNGDRITAQVTPNDGKVDGAVFTTDPVTVGNTAPYLVEIHLEPVPLRRGDPLKVKVVAADADGDPVTLSYKWLRNDKEIPGAKTDTLETKDFKKKDVLAVLVTASDGKSTREPQAGLPVAIENSPPSFTSSPPAAFKDGQYFYQVTVVDPDEDPVTLEVKQGPPGMTLDPATRQIVWKLTPESVGKHHVVLVAKDNDNGVTQQDFDLDAQLPAQAVQQ